MEYQFAYLESLLKNIPYNYYEPREKFTYYHRDRNIPLIGDIIYVINDFNLPPFTFILVTKVDRGGRDFMTYSGPIIHKVRETGSRSDFVLSSPSIPVTFYPKRVKHYHRYFILTDLGPYY